MATQTHKKTAPSPTSVNGKKGKSRSTNNSESQVENQHRTGLFLTADEEELKRLRCVAGKRFPQRKQRRMDALLSKASDTNLTSEERAELHRLTSEFEEGTIAKTEALVKLQELGEDITPYLRVPTDV